MDYWDEELRKAVHAMIPEVEGKPCVNVGEYDGGVYVCRRISGLATDEDCFNGTCEWVEPEDARPDELTDGMAISCDCVRLGPGWWQDICTSGGTSCTNRGSWPVPWPGTTRG